MTKLSHKKPPHPLRLYFQSASGNSTRRKLRAQIETPPTTLGVCRKDSATTLESGPTGLKPPTGPGRSVKQAILRPSSGPQLAQAVPTVVANVHAGKDITSQHPK